ncbi:MAG: hypothetical protein M1155_01205 [Patescibacteria group bacterium]|nr:hypothetical protein [Patescibacteria group bacterium]
MEFKWKAPEFKYYYKERSWYWTAGIFFGALFLIALYQKSMIIAIFWIITGVTVMMWAKRLPKTIEFKITDDGVHFGKIKFFPYEELTGFAIKKDNQEAGELILKTDSKINPVVKINMFMKDEDAIRDILKNFTDEVEYEESFFDIISDKIGF